MQDISTYAPQIKDICINMMKLLQCSKKRNGIIELSPFYELVPADNGLDLVSFGQSIICIRLEDLFELCRTFNDIDVDEPASYKVIIRDDVFYISSEDNHFINKMHIDIMEEYNSIDLTNSIDTLHDMKNTLKPYQYSVMVLYNELLNKIPCTMFIRFNYRNMTSVNFDFVSKLIKDKLCP